MAGYYPTVDALIVASTEEGAGLPALEASAAGLIKGELQVAAVPIEQVQR
jgi:hypothetical protein